MTQRWLDGLLAAAVGLAAIMACGGKGGTSNASNYPLAQTPAEVLLQTKPPQQPLTTHTKNAQGQYEVLPVKGVRIRVAAPWPGDFEVTIDGVQVPKETGQFTPTCLTTNNCYGYFKIGSIDATPPTPHWDLTVLIPDNKTGPTIPIEIRHVSLRPGVTGSDLKSAPLTLTLVTAPVVAVPPPPSPTADAHFAIRFPASEFSECRQDLSWDWVPDGALGASGINSAFKLPGNMQFTEYKAGPVTITDPGEQFPSWYCVYKDEKLGLATGPWKITVTTPQNQVASCQVTLSAGDNSLGFEKNTQFCRLKLGGIPGDWDWP